MKIVTISALILTAVLVARADTIRLTTGGKAVSGRVLGYTNTQFVVESEKHIISRLPANSVKSVDFENDSHTSLMETTDNASIKGKISGYDKGYFSVEDADGEVTRVPLKTVLAANFGNNVIPETDEVLKEPAATPAAASKKDAKETVVKVAQVTDAQLDKHLVRGKVTIVDFYADWCGPCRSIAPYLEELAKKDDLVVLRKVDVDKNSALASQFGVRSIPNIVIYNKSGKNIGTIRGADRDGVANLVAKAKE